MISRFAYALLRSVLVVLIIALPSLLLPGTNADTAQIVALVAIFGAILTFIEYTADYPGLVEFRMEHIMSIRAERMRVAETVRGDLLTLVDEDFFAHTAKPAGPLDITAAYRIMPAS